MKVSKGSVFKRRDSRYLYLNFSVDGKRVVQKTKYTHDQFEMVKKEVLPLVRAKILSGEIVLTKEEANNKTFEYYSSLYLKTKEKTVKPSTYKNTTNITNMWRYQFDDRDIKTIKPSEIKEILYGFDITGGSAKQYLSVLRNIFNEALYDEVIKDNPCDRFKAPRDIHKKEVFPFEQDEVKLLLNNSNGWFQNFLATAFYTGARVGELFALKWQNIDLKKKRLLIDSSRGDYVEGTTKTNKSRYIPIFDNLIPYLKKQQRITGMKTYVFLTDRGNNLRASNVRDQKWIPLLKSVKVPYRSLYQTRHTFATTLLNSNQFSLNEIAKILGHANIQMLIKHYNKYMEDEISKIDTNFDPFCDDFCNGVSKSA